MPKISLMVKTRTRLDEPARDLVRVREIIAEMQEAGALRVPSSMLDNKSAGNAARISYPPNSVDRDLIDADLSGKHDGPLCLALVFIWAILVVGIFFAVHATQKAGWPW